MSDKVAAFYDGLASRYHLIFADWHRSIERQSTILDELISDLLGPGPKRTQALGLAVRGHAVTAADVSAQAVARARTEAERLHVEIDFRVCDMRELHRCVQSGFEVVISCDNSLPHLLKAEELAEAVASIHPRLDPGAVFIASMRDYDAILEERPTATPIGLRTIQGRRRLAFQICGAGAQRIERLRGRSSGLFWKTADSSRSNGLCQMRAGYFSRWSLVEGALSSTSWISVGDTGSQRVTNGWRLRGLRPLGRNPSQASLSSHWFV